MPIALRWVGPEELDRVALTRVRCYAHAEKELERFKESARSGAWSHCAKYLLAEGAGQGVGTATHLDLSMNVRGASLPCQGVAWVGAIKTMRRRGGGSSHGVASSVMREMLRYAREREYPLTALMPFRPTFYEHFGYGLVERRHEWTVPISLFPAGDFEGIRFYEPEDFTARSAAMRQVARAGQCDIERPDGIWAVSEASFSDGFQVVDRPDGGGPIKGWMFFTQQNIEGKNTLVVTDHFYSDAGALQRQLYFLSSLRDQYSEVVITLPADLPLNRLLKEPQLPHRPVSHATARFKAMTRMQVRVLDHVRFLRSLNLPATAKGRTVLEIHECEGTATRLSLEINAGKVEVRSTDATPEFQCTDRTWAAIACGDLPASQALYLGLASGNSGAACVLDCLSDGSLPFCHEYF